MYKRIVSLVVVQSYFFYILALAEQIRQIGLFQGALVDADTHPILNALKLLRIIVNTVTQVIFTVF